jgi:geranylgeranyl reductase family protein
VIAADVAVVGAGPAGAAAAIELARAGADVLVIDRARFPRDKCCGDGLTTGALRLLEHLGLQPSAVASWTDVDSAWIRSPSGREIAFKMPRGRGQFAAVSARIELDAALVDVARASGAKVHDGHAVHQVDVGPPGSVTLEVAGLGPVSAQYVVAADGMWSPVRRLLGLTPRGYLGEWHAFRQYAEQVEGSAAEHLHVWFEPELLPGYAWSFPLAGGRANVGFGVLRGQSRRVQDMKRLWPDLLARPHVRNALGPQARLVGMHKAWPIPARIDRAVLGRGRVLFVGDAACATDVLTGEGIGQALLTGVLAARAITAEASIGPAAVQQQYHRDVRQELVPDHRMSMALGQVLRSSLGARAAVRVAGASPWTRENFARWLFEDEPRAVVLTPRRWHRRFLDRDGAYA